MRCRRANRHLAFTWLLLTRVISVLVGRGSSDFEKQRQIYYWATGGGYYIVFMFLVAFLPMPRFGFGRPSSYGYVWDSWWQVPPHDVMAWGFLSFGALGLTKLFERPEWIERSAEE